jgi:hypothetical protein
MWGKRTGDAVSKQWRANVALVAWALLFAVNMLTMKGPFIGPLSGLVAVLIAWDYGLRPALAWVALTLLLLPAGLFALGIGPLIIFAQAQGLVAMIQGATLVAVTVLVYLTDRLHMLTKDLRDSKSALLRLNAELQRALAEVKELRGLLPICAWCKDIRDVDGDWQRIESYISRNSGATFTHGLCPKCLAGQMAALK